MTSDLYIYVLTGLVCYSYILVINYIRIPSIQFSINQKVHTMTQVSPHMLIHGRNLRDIVDFKTARETLDQIKEEHLFDQSKLEIINALEVQLALARQRRDENYEKYVIIMKRNYDESRFSHSFAVGDLVAYFVGDRAHTNHKLQRRFTGPWEVIQVFNDGDNQNTVRIKNVATGEEFACHVCMIKHYYKEGFVPLLELSKSDRAKRQAEEKQIKADRRTDIFHL